MIGNMYKNIQMKWTEIQYVKTIERCDFEADQKKKEVAKNKKLSKITEVVHLKNKHTLFVKRPWR